MPVSASDEVLTWACLGVVMVGSVLWVVWSRVCRWHRARRGVPTPGVPAVFLGRLDAIREAEERTVRAEMIAGHVERIAAAECERVGHLYDVPTQPSVDVAVREASRVNSLFRP